MQKKIEDLLCNMEKSAIDVYIDIYKYILANSKEKGPIELRNIMETSERFDMDSHTEATNQQKNIYKKVGNIYFDYLQDLILLIAKTNPAADTYYSKLYSMVFASDLFPQSETERGILLYFMAQKMVGIPYYQASPSIEISDEETSNIFKNIDNPLKQAMFMLNGRFSNTKDEANQLYEISKNITDEKEKIIYWAVVISKIKKNRDNTEAN